MRRRVPPACVRSHAIDDLSHAHDAAERRLGRQTDAETTFNIFAACIVSPKRRVNENATAIAHRPRTVLDVFDASDD